MVWVFVTAQHMLCRCLNILYLAYRLGRGHAGGVLLQL